VRKFLGKTLAGLLALRLKIDHCENSCFCHGAGDLRQRKLLFALKPARTIIKRSGSADGNPRGSRDDPLVIPALKAVLGLALIAGVSALLGAIIGLLCRGRALLEFIASIVVSVSFLFGSAWIAGTLSNEWSWEHPMWSVMYHLGPYVLFLLLPTAAMAALVGNRSRN
jgi:hypothetical protein